MLVVFSFDETEFAISTVDGSEILHQWRLVAYPIVYRVLAPSQVVVWDFVHQQ